MHYLVLGQHLKTKGKFPLSMTKLHYVGFNGYCQCPTNKDDLPKVVTSWISIAENETVKACNHRFIIVETTDFFKIYGLLTNNSNKRLQVVAKPEKIDNLGSCDEYLIASSGTNIWKYNYTNSEWIKCEYKFLTDKENFLWDNAENRILKFSFNENFTDVILLISNGSVWLQSEDNKLRLLLTNDLEKAVDISSGVEHTLILTESGSVLAFGNGSRGQLGHGDLNSIAQPIQIAALEGLKVTKIAAGGWHSCAITDSGDLYTWGWNNFGQLSSFEDGVEIGLTALPVIAEIEGKPEIGVVDVACGRRHTIVKLGNGDFYSSGWNTYSQLGIESSCEKVAKFTKCQIQRSQNRRMICGPWYTILIDEPK